MLFFIRVFAIYNQESPFPILLRCFTIAFHSLFILLALLLSFLNQAMALPSEREVILIVLFTA